MCLLLRVYIDRSEYPVMLTDHEGHPGGTATTIALQAPGKEPKKSPDFATAR